MKIMQFAIILINLTASIYLIFMIVSFHHGRRFSRMFGMSRTSAVNLFKQIYSLAAVGMVVYTFFFFDITIATISSSVFFFFLIVLSKILIDSSTYYALNPSKKIDQLGSILTVAMFFSVFILIVSIGILVEN